MEALVLEGIRKSFGRTEVLRGIDLAVAEHEVVCLIGASGSGKSTLLRCVNLIERVDSGRIFVRGEEITARGVDANRVRRRIGIVFQAFNLFPHMSVLRNVTLAQRTALVGVLGSIEAFKQTQIDQAATFNFTSGLAAAVLFVAVTIPLTRLADWLVSRDRRRRQAAGVAA